MAIETYKKRKPYPTDLTDEQWELIQPEIPEPPGGGRHAVTSFREVVNAIFYLNKTGCQWKMLPHDFPPEGTVRFYFHKWNRAGVFEKVHEKLRQKVRIEEPRDPEPSAMIIDSQSVKTTKNAGECGYDAGKKISGVKRHIAVDTLGILVCVVMTVASVQDRDGAKLLFDELAAQGHKRLQLIWADGGYRGKLEDWVLEQHGWKLEIVKRSDDVKGFKVLPRRWVVERTFSWLDNSRRLSKNYEYDMRASKGMVILASMRLMLNRLCKHQNSA